MEENRKESVPVYYNAPRLKDVYTSPVVVVGILDSEGEQGKHSIRIVIRRDLSVKLSAFALKYRLSGGDDGEKYYQLVYDRDDLNTRKYLYIVLNVPKERYGGVCTALVSAVTFENGKSVPFRLVDYETTEATLVGGNFRNPDLSTASPFLREYIEYLAAKGKNGAAGSGKPAPEQRPRPVQPNSESVRRADSTPPRERQIRKSRRSFLSTPGGILVAVLVGAAVIALAGTALSSRKAPDPKDPSEVKIELSEKELSNLLASKNFSKAYQLVSLYGDVVDVQNVCEQAVKHYESVSNFDKAYLYASAAPDSFEKKVIASFAEYFIEQNRFEEAYDFLLTLNDSGDGLQTLCDAAVEYYLDEGDFLTAYSYGEKAPVSLTENVFRAAEESLLREGEINPGALAVLQMTDHDGELDLLIAENAGSIADFEIAYSLAVSIKDEVLRAGTVYDVALGRMKTLVDENNLTDAYALYADASAYITDKQKQECQTRMVSYSAMKKNTAGEILFRTMRGEDTSVIAVQPEELSVRGNLGEVYFLLTEKQKRDYHSVCFDLYKEAYYIQSGALAGTDITDAVSVSTFEYQTIVLHADGTVSALDNDGHNLVLEMPADRDIVQIAAGRNHAVFLHNDGTVTGCGNGKWGQLSVSGWKNVVKVVSGADFTVGLLADGTLVACGSNLSGQCEVSGYTRVMDIAACDQSLVILFRDGSVKMVGNVSFGLKRADQFTGIKRIRAAAACVIAETENGTYKMAHEGTDAYVGSVLQWSNVRWFAAGAFCIGNVDTYGRINVEGDGAPIKGLD